MTSFINLGLFEREAKSPGLNTKQLALLLCGEDPETKVADISNEKKKAYDIYYRHISKWISSSRIFNGTNATSLPADYMFALAYPMIDDQLTPTPIKDRCLKAVATIAAQNKGKEILHRLGGDELQKKGMELSKNKRGLYKKEDEELNSDKLLALIIKLLVKKVGFSYGEVSKPSVSNIRNDIHKMAEEEGVSLSGLSRSTIDKKIGNALKSLYL
ncbi:hypothetical protein N6P31_12880 [Pectobacterium betavasculorum]|uniref:hypothetical protein n=1 Tax=Pectobacterium betavasculorum TaxID=55207 RepID=UPI00313CC9F0